MSIETQVKEDVKEAAAEVQETVAEVKESAADIKDNIQDSASIARAQISASIDQATDSPKETVKGMTRQMADADQQSVSAADLKRRLDWGEPALTIIDVRHAEDFQQERIMGAISMPEADLVEQASSTLEAERDIFVYGATSTQMSQAAMSLADAGFEKVAVIEGALSGWKQAAGQTEGIAA